ATAQPTMALIAQAVGGAADHLLAPAVTANVIRIDGDAIEFVHPLLAAAAYSLASPAERRRWHTRIAEVAPDPETRARHLAFARPGADPEIARELAEAARHALQRGAPGVAAELFGRALDRVPDAGDPLER